MQFISNRMQALVACNKNMKLGFILLLLFSAIFHFVFPFIYFEMKGFQTIYQAFPPVLFDRAAWIKVVLLNLGSFGLASLLVFFFPLNRKFQPFKMAIPHAFYIITCLWGGYFIWRSHGFEGVLEGQMLGTWVSYIGIFLGGSTAFTLTLVYIENSNVFLLGGIQIFLGIVYGSRSTPIFIIINLCILLASNVEYKKLRNFVIVTVISGIFSVFLYNLANNIRNISWGKTSEVKTVAIQGQQAENYQIMGRISMLETGMLPIIYKDKKINPVKLELFYEKYSLRNQLNLFKNYFFPRRLKNVINSYYPGFFTFDLLPNQYYREIFLNYSKESVQAHYLSINLTLPVYIYMYTNFWIAILLSGLVLFGFYLLINLAANSYPLLALALFFNTYYLIYFFDLTDLLVSILRSFLTCLTFYIFYKISTYLHNKFKAKQS